MTPDFSSLLRTRAFGRTARLVDVCGSTNDEAAAWARAAPPERAPEGAVVMAGEQTRGRGRLGRSWHSPPGDDLYLSLVLRPSIAPHRAPPLALVAAVALAESVEALGLRPELKWPNDLLLDGRKVAGILTEMATGGAHIEHVIVGIGVNLHAREFPEEIAARATSLALARGGAGPDRDALAASLLAHLEAWYQRFLDGGAAPVVAAWKERARLLGRRVTVSSGRERHQGTAQDVDDEGALLLRTDGGALLRVVAGEIA